MGWGDRYESHFYVGISADTLMMVIKEQYPGLRLPGGSPSQSETAPILPAPSDSGPRPSISGVDDRSHTIVVVAGSITLKDQLHEYAFRGEELSGMSYLDFMLDTYDAKSDEHDAVAASSIGPDEHAESSRQVCRTRNRRVAYRQGFTRLGRCRVFCTTGHETLPHFLGGWFPRSDREKERELYCASMLALLRPWTDLSQLKTDAESFEHVFNTFIDAVPKRTKDIVENIQLLSRVLRWCQEPMGC